VVTEYLVGVDFGATNLKAVVATPDGAVVDRHVEPSFVHEGPKSTLRRIGAVVTRFQRRWRVARVGIAVCGPVDRASGALVESPVLPGWRDVPVVAALRESLGPDVVMDNDGNLAILGEWWLGAGERSGIVAGLTLGTGIGGGLIVGGRVFRGATGWAGEFGHIAVADGPRCPCGGQGCLGVLASATATLLRYRSRTGREVAGTAELVRIADGGDADAVAALSETVGHLAHGVRVLVNTLNPHVVVLAGGMAGWGVRLADAVGDGLRATTFAGVDTTPVRTARLGMFSGALGAVRLALDEATSKADGQP
jgi:glucokinase